MDSAHQGGADGNRGGSIDSDPRTVTSPTAVERAPVCESCGADVRGGSLFCYSCGKPVEHPETEPVLEHSNELVVPEADPLPPTSPPLKSAASLRKKRRAMNREPIQVSWEAPKRTPVAFYVATIFLTVAAVVLLILALYLR